MKASEFNLQQELRFHPERGYLSFRDSRVVIFDANALGLLRQQLIEELGTETARRLLLRFGFLHGYSDFMQVKTDSPFDSERELLAAGPVMHSWEGIVLAQPADLSYSRETGDFLFTGVWKNSYEAEQHLSFNPQGSEPVCWTLMGYASGWCSAFFGSPLVAIEPRCVGRGDPCCEWKIQPPEAWGREAHPHVQAYHDLFEGGSCGRKAA